MTKLLLLDPLRLEVTVMHYVASIMQQVSFSKYYVASIMYHVSCVMCHVSSIKYQVSSIKQFVLVPRSKQLVASCQYQVSSIKYQISASIINQQKVAVSTSKQPQLAISNKQLKACLFIPEDLTQTCAVRSLSKRPSSYCLIHFGQRLQLCQLHSLFSFWDLYVVCSMYHVLYSKHHVARYSHLYLGNPISLKSSQNVSIVLTSLGFNQYSNEMAYSQNSLFSCQIW